MVADDIIVAEKKEEQVFETIESDLLVEEIDPSIFDNLLNTDLKEEYVCTCTENVPVNLKLQAQDIMN